MAFSFGGANVATSQPNLFGSPATSTNTGFGGFGTGLGSFGNTAASTAPSTGFGFAGFGAAPATTTTAPSMFGAFGTNTTSASPFSFTTPASSTSTGFGGFGSGVGAFGTATTSATGTGFGFGGFGSTAVPASSSSLFGSFGTTTVSASPFSFSNPATSTAPAFGGFGTGSTTFGGGLGSTGTTSSLAGFGGGSGFGAGTSAFGGTGANLFGAPQPQNAQQQEEMNLAAVAMAVFSPQIYGDERDAIIAKWNSLQAAWGSGKGFFSQNGVVDFKPENPYCRFKALGYNLIPTGSNEEGHVVLLLTRKEEEVTAAQQQIVDMLHRILGSKPTLSVCVEGIKSLPENRTEMVIYVLERPAQGPAKRVPATELFNFLNQPAQKSQIVSQLSVENMCPKVRWTSEQLKEYLEKSPSGVDNLLWQQAKLDNPDPDNFIPVPMVGFKELQKRLKFQDEQTKLYQQRLDVMTNDIVQLQTQHSTMLSKLEDFKRKDLELGHRLLKVIVKQEIYRKMGFAIQPEEETLRVQLEQLQAELNHPTQFKGRLNELMSQMRMQAQTSSGRGDQSYQMDVETQAEIKQILKQQQEGLQHLIEIIKEDATDLQLIEQGMAKSNQVKG